MDSGDGLSGSLRDCRPALQKGQKYQRVKNLTCEGANSLNQTFFLPCGIFRIIRCKFEDFS